MVDTSSSINGKDNFQLVTNFVTSVFHSFTLGKGVRYGLVVFGTSAKVNIFLQINTMNFIHYGKVISINLTSYSEQSQQNVTC